MSPRVYTARSRISTYCAVCGGPIYAAASGYWHNERHEELVARCRAAGIEWIHEAVPVDG